MFGRRSRRRRASVVLPEEEGPERETRRDFWAGGRGMVGGGEKIALICEDRWVVGSKIVSELGEVEVEGVFCVTVIKSLLTIVAGRKQFWDGVSGVVSPKITKTPT